MSATIKITLAHDPAAASLGRAEKEPYQITKIVGAIRVARLVGAARVSQKGAVDEFARVGDYLTEEQAVYLSTAPDTEVTVVPAKD